MTSRAPNINRSKIHEERVQQLAVVKLSGYERSIFPTIRELLCFAAILGFSENRKIKLDKRHGVEDVSYQQFERGDAEDLIYMIALAHTKDPKVLQEGKESFCAEIFEEYANGGLFIISDKLSQTGGEYANRDILELLKELGYLWDKDGPTAPDITF